MISYLRAEFAKDGYNVSDTYKEYPSLPIDLFCTKGKGKAQECCAVIVAALSHISADYQKKLLFYQYFLSLHYKPSQYKVIMAIPDSATVETTWLYAEQEEEQKQDFYKVNGFGLWKIKIDGEIDKDTCNPITLRDKIARDFENIIVKEQKVYNRLSQGILCSPKELGWGEFHLGIMAFTDELAPGTELAEFVPPVDHVIDIDNKTITE